MTDSIDLNKKPFIDVSVAPDYYSASVTVEFNHDSAPLMREDLIDALNRKSVVFGIDHEAIDSLVEGRSDARDIVVAKGVPHSNGADSSIIFLVSVETDKCPKEVSGGKVDFKDLGYVNMIQKGTVIARRSEPTPGSEGMTVTGRAVKGRMGKTISFRCGRNVEVSEDGLALIASATGTAQYDGDKVSIIEVLEVRGDVGIKTGNIKFTGKIVVWGNVSAGYEVSSEEDIEVRGIVEGARIACKGDLDIFQGVQGNDAASLEVGGNLKSTFLNNCNAKVGGNIWTDSVLNCFIACDGFMVVKGKRGAIIGGEFDVRKEIKANVIGSETGTVTTLRLGIDSKIIEEFKETSDQLKLVKDNFKKLEQIIRLLKKQLDADPKDKTAITNYNKALENLRKVAREDEALTKRFSELNGLINELQDASVTAGTLYTGTKIKIGSSYYHPKDDLMDVAIRRDGGKIVAASI